MRSWKASSRLALLTLAFIPEISLASAGAQINSTEAIVPRPLPAGTSRLAGGACAYRPPGKHEGTRPLILLLHGAGGNPCGFLAEFRDLANHHGVVLLAPKAKGETWDLESGQHKKIDADSPHIQALLDTVFQNVAVDRQRVTVLGFSDGASYALSLGLANPQMFRSVVAFSPGFLIAPQRLDVTQRVFVSHGRLDEVLPFGNVHDRIVPALRAAGYSVTTRWFPGWHEVPARVLREGVAFAAGATR